MKRVRRVDESGFTLAEVLVSLGISTVILAALITASVAMQKSFNAVDNYFATHMQQVRIIDYLNRDVKRAFSVVSTITPQQTITITVPNYLIQAGDPEAVANPQLVGTPRSPTITNTLSGPQVNYGPPGGPSTTTVVYSIVNNTSIQRTENGVVTIIASSTDQLLPTMTDTELDLSNTEFTKTTVTFQPIFMFGNNAAERSGTTVFATSYLRNKRRG